MVKGNKKDQIDALHQQGLDNNEISKIIVRNGTAISKYLNKNLTTYEK